mmetsp:Transcript_23313/g.38856  ORF Transcript_23313/g.38856 Transcript_23313/m.38856 type:complete len:322 (-) Transcript_23313:820-1785(-)
MALGIVVVLILVLIKLVAAVALFGNGRNVAGNNLIQLTNDDLEAFDRDGFLLMRGLLKGNDLQQAIAVARSATEEPWQFPNSPYRKVDFNNLRGSSVLQRIATKSNAAHVVRQIMGNHIGDDIRILKDAVLAFEPNKSGCGWHVDDQFFWPTPIEPQRPDAHPGVNVWIALSPIRKSFGGGLAIAPTSHKAGWMTKARSIIFDSRQTCAMAELSPEYHNACEALRTTFDMEPGDAIIHTRWMFHRSDDFTQEGVEQFNKNGKKALLRYSIRYMPGDSPICNFTGMEPFSKEDAKLEGKPLKASNKWFPKVFGRTSSLLQMK